MTIRKQLIYSFMGSLFITTLLVFILYKLMWFDVHQTILLTLCSFVSSMMTMAIAIFFSVPTIHKIERLNDCTDQIAKGNYKVGGFKYSITERIKRIK